MTNNAKNKLFNLRLCFEVWLPEVVYTHSHEWLVQGFVYVDTGVLLWTSTEPVRVCNNDGSSHDWGWIAYEAGTGRMVLVR